MPPTYAFLLEQKVYWGDEKAAQTLAKLAKSWQDDDDDDDVDFDVDATIKVVTIDGFAVDFMLVEETALLVVGEVVILVVGLLESKGRTWVLKSYRPSLPYGK